MDIFEREEMLIGKEAVKGLSRKKVALFGVGGVGAVVGEILARSGVGTIAAIDSDRVNTTNINRQIIALHTTVGRLKTEVLEERLKDINPKMNVRRFDMFYDKDSCDEIDLSKFDYIVDAIDTVTSKILLIKNAKEANVPIISSMGTGNKLGINFEVADIYQTSVCPLARVMRKLLKDEGINSLKVVYSKEVPQLPKEEITENGRHIPASIAFAPWAAAITIAREAVLDLMKTEPTYKFIK